MSDVNGQSHAAHEIRSARIFAVDRAALFAAFENPAMLATWWGPDGSVNVFEVFDFRVGGDWRFTMRAADDVAYSMHNRFVEIVAPERIVIEHVQAGHEFSIAMAYDALGDSHTRLSWCMRFASADEAERVRLFVTAANEQNFDRLETVFRNAIANGA